MYTYKKFFLSLLTGLHVCMASQMETEETQDIQQWREAALASENDRQAALLWDRILYFSDPTDEERRQAAATYYRNDDYNKASALYEKLVDVDQPSVHDCRNFLICFNDFAWGQTKLNPQTLALMPRIFEIIRKDTYSSELDNVLIGKIERILSYQPQNLADPEQKILQRTLDFDRQATLYSSQLGFDTSLSPKKKAKLYYKLGKLRYDYALFNDDIDEKKAYLEEAKVSFRKVSSDKVQPYLENINLMLKRSYFISLGIRIDL